MIPPYAELQVTTNFSFLRGGSHAHELIARAKALGLAAIAITDRNTLAGVVRAHTAAKQHGLKLIVGTRLDLEDGPSLLVYPGDRTAYGRLCRLLTLGQRRAAKGECELYLSDIAPHAKGQIFIALPPEDWNFSAHPNAKGCSPNRSKSSKADRPPPTQRALAASGINPFEAQLRQLEETLDAPVYLAASFLYRGSDRARIEALSRLALRCGTPLIATNDVLYHDSARRALQDALTCIRKKCQIGEAGLRLEANAERHLKAPREMARLFRGFEAAVSHTAEIAGACRFCLDELVYEYPDEPVPADKTPQSHLEDLTWEGARWRFPSGVPEKVAETLIRELALIADLRYAPYFLTVYDIVKFAREQAILCQGRGSAANSAVCYCLGITSVDPTQIDLLFERFVSLERKEPPDIDVDFEHERREEVIQYIYERYGRERAGLAATVICYRSRSALREVGKAMGLEEDTLSALAPIMWGMQGEGAFEGHIREAGLDPADPLLRRVVELANELIGFPRHLSQHVGGFVLTRGLLCEIVPIANAAMEDRTVIEWDKDDLAALGLLKVDVLGLGMLSCIHKCFDSLETHYARPLTLASVPREDPAVYDMLCKADSLGVFQVESRAQMNMLPRLKPRCFYDLVIDVAIVRPGPIQGDMVHPYLRRRDGLEAVEYPRPSSEHGPPNELEDVLKKTLGIPLFQEQAMRIAIVAARFSAEEANQLRHAMATFRRRGAINTLKDKFVSRMVARGYRPDLAERCFKQIEGFGEYGFPESHSASFSLLVYVSSWLKCHYPAAFACALLNSQPMGFYAPAQIVRGAREHGVEVGAVDVNWSEWDCTLEPGSQDKWTLRLGFRQVDGLREADATKIIETRLAASQPFARLDDLWRQTGVPRSMLELLASADAFRSMGLDRRQALWDVRALNDAKPLPLFEQTGGRETGEEPHVQLPLMALSEHVVNDYQTLRLSLKAHPMSFLRRSLNEEKIATCEDVKSLDDGARVSLAGLVLVRQRPGSAKGVIFMTLEDETGIANVVVWPKVLERYRKTVIGARLMFIHGRIQRHEEIIHIIANGLEDRSHWLLALVKGRGDLASPLVRAGELARPSPGSWRPGRQSRAHRIIPQSRDFH